MFTNRPCNSVIGAEYSHRMPALMVSEDSMRQSSVKYASYTGSRRYLSALP